VQVGVCACCVCVCVCVCVCADSGGKAPCGVISSSKDSVSEAMGRHRGKGRLQRKRRPTKVPLPST